MSDDGEIDYPLPPEEEVVADDAQRAADDAQRAADDAQRAADNAQRAEKDAEAVRRASKERRDTIVPALDGGVELQGAAGGLDSGGAEGAAEEAAVPTNIETFFGPGWTAESVHAQVLQLVEGLRVAENTSKYHLQTMLEAQAKAEAAAAVLVDR